MFNLQLFDVRFTTIRAKRNERRSRDRLQLDDLDRGRQLKDRGDSGNGCYRRSGKITTVAIFLEFTLFNVAWQIACFFTFPTKTR